MISEQRLFVPTGTTLTIIGLPTLDTENRDVVITNSGTLI
jgi:hypothetical protein